MRVEARRLREASPDPPPLALLAAELLGAGELALGLRIEGEARLADRAEGSPHPRAPLLPGARWIVEPAQDVADRICGQQVVEVRGLEPAPAQARHRGVGELRQRAVHRLQGLGVLCDVEAEAAAIALEEGEHRPVAGVLLGPEHAAVLQLGERLQVLRAALDAAKIETADPGEVENRNDVLGPVSLGQRSGDHALDPRRGTGARRLVVLAEREELGQHGAQRGDERRPLLPLVRPQNEGRDGLDVAVVDGCSLQRRQQGVEDLGRTKLGHGSHHITCSRRSAYSSQAVASEAGAGSCNVPRLHISARASTYLRHSLSRRSRG